MARSGGTHPSLVMTMDTIEWSEPRARGCGTNATVMLTLRAVQWRKILVVASRTARRSAELACSELASWAQAVTSPPAWIWVSMPAERSTAQALVSSWMRVVHR